MASSLPCFAPSILEHEGERERGVNPRKFQTETLPPRREGQPRARVTASSDLPTEAGAVRADNPTLSRGQASQVGPRSRAFEIAPPLALKSPIAFELARTLPLGQGAAPIAGGQPLAVTFRFRSLAFL